MTEAQILDLIERDTWRMEVLRAARVLNLPDWWIGAGFVRNLVWDELHGYRERTPLADVDMIYFNPTDEPIEAEKQNWQQLKTARPDVIWSVTNVAHRHLRTGSEPYRSATDGLAHWVETATCVGVRLQDDDTLELTAPHGIEDLVDLVVRFNPQTHGERAVFTQRYTSKGWLEHWPKLQVVALE